MPIPTPMMMATTGISIESTATKVWLWSMTAFLAKVSLPA
jgi:hypothetical protein